MRIPVIRTLLISLVLCITAAKSAATHLGVQDRFLYSPCGERIVLMGPNRMVYWMDRTGLSSFAEIAKTGANSVRIVWTTEGSAAELDTVLKNARRHQLLPIIELHDAAGDWSKLSDLIEYWRRPDIVATIAKHQAYTIVNIGNEVGDDVLLPEYIEGYSKAIERLRQAGYKTPLMIDAPGWGKDIDTLQAAGPALIEADPQHNILLSVHMWWPKMWGYDAARVRSEIIESVEAKLPLIIGEFGDRWDDTEGGQIPYRTIIKTALEFDVGFLPWSWGPGNKPQQHLDMSDDGSFEGLTGWGREVMLDEAYSIAKNAVKPNWRCMTSPAPELTPQN
ncbi:cellulase family glycosylhydrolase [Gilvimarinus sp. SDUM040013]|uniref:Cellulase family glycosylhydrolase n=1 Tax=Gilvimarinus gilvus TaxID=3058038 RepID=A0ABU4RXI6_9GAMM|nr:cellulase family glycosylhydrolase [Gilvimarinus sp. SDUM040013]MDO3388635.1 cellulase family glycosylhydrolase [Gilvimarinus sp. SDUM040013]MDX6849530.1 cellulase family glycosylhydrolase [Gilvimarinus sp. SDUM040013]